MNSRIEFKGKRIDNSEIVIGDLITSYTGKKFIKIAEQDGWYDYEVNASSIELKTESGEWKSVNDIKII